LFATPEGVVLSYAFTTANVHDSKMAPVLLQDIEDQHVLFSIADPLMIITYIYKIADMCDIFPVNPINPRNGEQIKSSHRRVLSHFVTTTFWETVDEKSVGKLNRSLVNSKIKGLEQPRWYGQNRYLLHVQLVFSDS
jgi:IS5 family transposase